MEVFLFLFFSFISFNSFIYQDSFTVEQKSRK
jgi:hypothetical protein